jgi:hypothetical protein
MLHKCSIILLHVLKGVEKMCGNWVLTGRISVFFWKKLKNLEPQEVSLFLFQAR